MCVAFEWKPGFTQCFCLRNFIAFIAFLAFFSYERPCVRCVRLNGNRALDYVVGNLTIRYGAASDLDELFGVLRQYPNMSSEDM